MSPSLMRHNNNPPSFLHHPDTCDCPPCSLPLLHQVILKIMFTQAWSLVLQEDVEQAKSTFALLHETFQLLSNKTESAIKRQNITTDDQLEDLRYIYMGCLLQEAECLAWHQLWDDVSEVNKKYSQVVNDISGSYLDNNPSLLVWHAEQVRSCEMLREKEERRRRKEEEDMMMVTQMQSLLQCHDQQEDVVTPECTKTTNSRIGQLQFINTTKTSFYNNYFSRNSKEMCDIISRCWRSRKLGQKSRFYFVIDKHHRERVYGC